MRKNKKAAAPLPGGIPRAGKSSDKMPGFRTTKQTVSSDMRRKASAAVKPMARAARIAKMEKRDGRV